MRTSRFSSVSRSHASKALEEQREGGLVIVVMSEIGVVQVAKHLGGSLSVELLTIDRGTDGVSVIMRSSSQAANQFSTKPIAKGVLRSKMIPATGNLLIINFLRQIKELETICLAGLPCPFWGSCGDLVGADDAFLTATQSKSLIKSLQILQQIVAILSVNHKSPSQARSLHPKGQRRP